MSASLADQTIARETTRVGLLINPLAGIGGPSGNKGSDDTAIRARALSGKIALTIQARLARFFNRLKTLSLEQAKAPECDLACEPKAITFFQASGAMSADHHLPWLTESCNSSKEHGEYSWRFEVLYNTPEQSSARDTQALIAALGAQRIDLLIFAGGDGTARDIYSAMRTDSDSLNKGAAGSIPCVLGLPSGVKMHSGVFATSPEAAAEMLFQFASGSLSTLSEREVRDLNEADYRREQIRPATYGFLPTLIGETFSQAEKQSPLYDVRQEQADIAAEVVQRLEDESFQDASLIVLAGPGSSCKSCLAELGLEGSLLGVDVLTKTPEKGWQCLASDLDQRALHHFIDRNTRLIVLISPTGGQGFLFGRGNQQIDAKLLSRVRSTDLWIIATQEKLLRMEGRPLLIDLDDQAVGARFTGSRPVITGYQRETLVKVRLA